MNRLVLPVAALATGLALLAAPAFAADKKKGPAKSSTTEVKDEDEEAAAPAKPAPKKEKDKEEEPPPPDLSKVNPLGTNDASKTAPVAYTPGKGNFPRISDSEETIYAVQRKAYLVYKKVEVTPMVAATFTDRFVQNFAPAASVTYHLAENFGLEVFGSFMFPTESGLTTEILQKGKLTPEIAKLTQLRWAAGLGGQWSPIYGKLQMFGLSLGNFGFYLSAGAGIGQSRVQCTPGLPLDPQVFGQNINCDMAKASTNAEDAFKPVYEPLRTQLMGSFGGGLRLYFSNTLGLKLEIKDWIFPTRVYRPGTTEPTQRFTDAVRNNVFIQLGVSFLFGGEGN